MIRRVIEYMIICDARECVIDEYGAASAFGSPTLTDCAEIAARLGWKQVSARLWLCPDCAEKTKTNESE